MQTSPWLSDWGASQLPVSQSVIQSVRQSVSDLQHQTVTRKLYSYRQHFRRYESQSQQLLFTLTQGYKGIGVLLIGALQKDKKESSGA